VELFTLLCTSNCSIPTMFAILLHLLQLVDEGKGSSLCIFSKPEVGYALYDKRHVRRDSGRLLKEAVD
jgi:hypothetical protein